MCPHRLSGLCGHTSYCPFSQKNSKDNHRRGALSEEYAQRNHIFNGLHGLWDKAQLK